ncbi:MAG TPA: hypothetical protein VF298_07995 [Bacteroidales bacterium]
MKSRKLFQLSFILVALLGFSLTGCKKDNMNQGSTDTSSMLQLTTDEINVEDAMDDASKDAETVMSFGSGQEKSTIGLPCNATIDSTAIINDSISLFITYDGLNCNGTRNRTGKIEIKKAVGTHWGQAGATVIFKFIDFTVTRVAKGKSLKFNGTKIFQNVSGGFIWQLGFGATSIVHRINGAMQTTFDNGTSRTWNVARQITYTGTHNQLLINIDGFGTAGEYSNLVTWGTNRNDEAFYTQITQSVVHKELCSWDPVSGIKIHQIPSKSKSATITFGYNSNNEPITGDECPTKYRVDWQRNGNSGTIYVLLP